MSQQYFCPTEYTSKTKPKTNPKKLIQGLGLVSGLVLGFGLVCTPLGKNIVGSFFLVVPVAVISGLRTFGGSLRFWTELFAFGNTTINSNDNWKTDTGLQSESIYGFTNALFFNKVICMLSILFAFLELSVTLTWRGILALRWRRSSTTVP